MGGVCVYYGEALGRYGFGEGHPFDPQRLADFWRYFTSEGLDARVAVHPPVMASREAIERFHSRDYVELVIRRSRTGEGYLDYGDTPAFRGVYEAAATVVGTVLDAVDRLMEGACRRAFVPIAGLHHARRTRAGGFCVFNDIGVAVETLRGVYGVRRIAYVDIDAHHGDGVFYSYDDDPDLLIADFHEDGRYLYPGTGAAEENGRGPARGTKANVPLPPGADDERFLKEWPRVEAYLEAGRPEFFILQCGADSVAGDPLTHLAYSPAVHRHVARRLAALADRFAGGRLLALGGGGYDHGNIARAWTEGVRGLLEGA